MCETSGGRRPARAACAVHGRRLAIRLPPPSSPRRGPRKRPPGKGRACASSPQEEVTRRRSRPGGQLPARGRAPECVLMNDGQRPTTHRPPPHERRRVRGHVGFGRSPSSTGPVRRAGVEAGQQGAVLERDCPVISDCRRAGRYGISDFVGTLTDSLTGEVKEGGPYAPTPERSSKRPANSRPWSGSNKPRAPLSAVSTRGRRGKGLN